ncbi:SIMPL domain-containing protein [Pontibacter sp. G13]|uniref:SIMPL domain-containing protein n=1 Tax=Pontibacter sp. G13 TaxID=3074898 RepID=UPI002889E558|nr:SIMPL domain-containing protein [Pontibacter sp. G13]WNJ18342.1 SIMPL domain-containing protein [Pontibacter sp. G13]
MSNLQSLTMIRPNNLLALLLAAIICGCGYPLRAQQLGNAHYALTQNQQYTSATAFTPVMAQAQSGNSIELRVSGLSLVKADRYVAVFNLQQVAETASLVHSLMETRIAGLLHGLKDLAIEDEAVHIDLICLVPKYEFDVQQKVFSKSYNEVPVGFEMQQNLSIPFDNPAMLPQILALAAEQEIYDLVKVDYILDDPAKAKAELRKACIASWKEQEALHGEMGIRLDTLDRRFGDQFQVVVPQERYQTYTAYAQPNLAVANRKATVQRAEHSSTRFFHAISYKDYDVVLHPELTIPTVAITYNLVVRYQFPNPPAPIRHVEVQREFMLISPDGELSTLPLKP